MKCLATGSRVRVSISEGWHRGAVESLNGLTGEIVELSEPVDAWGRPKPTRFLVRFPERPKPWHANQIPSHSWWFDPNELELDD